MQSQYTRKLRSSSPAMSKARQHKHGVGTFVTLLGAISDPRSKDRKVGEKGTRFEITRLLPTESLGFQYRVRNITTGLEFVVVEEQIEQSC